jgi:hypothetical protein
LNPESEYPFGAWCAYYQDDLLVENPSCRDFRLGLIPERPTREEMDPQPDSEELERICIQQEGGPCCYECEYFTPGPGPESLEVKGKCFWFKKEKYGCSLSCQHFKQGRERPTQNLFEGEIL